MSCPFCGRGPRDDTAAVKIDERGAVWFCHRCQERGSVAPAEVDDFLQGRVVATYSAPIGGRGNARAAALHVFAESETITEGCPAGRYLLARGCTLPGLRSHLRWRPSWRHPSGYVGPALLALVSDPAANVFSTVHSTWIQANGTKAAVDKPRLFWRGLPARGVCRLTPDDEVHLGLAVAEGIETALSLARAFQPVWATLNAGNLAAFPYLYPIEALTIAVDGDEAGERAAARLREHWLADGAAHGIAVEITEVRNGR